MAQAKPEAAKVAPAAAGADGTAALLGAETAALEAGADTGADIGAEAGAETEADIGAEATGDAGATAALEADDAALVLDAEVELLSLPQALNVSAATAAKAKRPVVRVIFTPFPPQVESLHRPPGHDEINGTL